MQLIPRVVLIRLLQFVPFFWLLAYLLLLMPWSWYKLPRIEAEFAKILPPGDAELIRHETWFTKGPWITANYNTDLTVVKVTNHYHQQLIQNGWVYTQGDTYYCKGTDSASFDSISGPGYWFSIHGEDFSGRCGWPLGLSSWESLMLLGCSTTFLLPHGIIIGWVVRRARNQEYLQLRDAMVFKPRNFRGARHWAILFILLGVFGLL